VVDDGQYRIAGSDERLLLAAPSGQAPVAGAQEGVGTRVDERDAAQGAGQPRVALGAALADGLTGRLVDLRAELGPRHQMRGGGEPGHVDPDLGEQLGGGNGAHAGDVSAPGRRSGQRAAETTRAQ